MPKKLVKNNLYQVKFYDHSIGHSGEMIIIYVGWYQKQTDNFYVFSSWLTENESTREDNLEPCSVFKDAIISIKKLNDPSR